MITTEYLTINGKRFVKTYSTDGVKIRRIGTNELYDEAIDIEWIDNSYEETDIKIEGEDIWD